MNVLCNLFPIGVTHHGTRTRTGIYRVVENLVRGLAQSQEVQLHFHATGNFWTSYRFYSENLRGPSVHWAAPGWQVFLSIHLAGVESFIYSTLARRAALWRLARKLAAIYLGCWHPLLSRVSARLLASVNIYHSPFLPIPEWVRRQPHLLRFTTVYDVIPLTHPQYFTADGGIPELLHRLVKGLGPEDWVLCISEANPLGAARG